MSRFIRVSTKSDNTEEKDYESDLDQYPARTVCAILDDMRSCQKTHNYSYLAGLIEELQWYANRMEASLDERKCITSYAKIKSEMKAEIKTLNKDIKQLRKEKAKCLKKK